MVLEQGGGARAARRVTHEQGGGASSTAGRLPASHGREDGEGGIESMTRGPHMSLRWRLRVKTAQRRSKQPCPRPGAKSERI